MERMKFWIMLGLGLTLGLLIATIDSRPSWDDTGITAGAVLIATGLLGLIYPQRAWLWALAVGLWIPAWGILAHQNYGALIALVFAFAGAYGGALTRKILKIMYNDLK